MAKSLTTEEFIEKARKVHGEKYDYSKVEYKNNLTKVCIICHEKDENGVEHGEFWQLPGNHIHKTLHRGCPKCGGFQKIDTEEFIKRAKAIHGDKYDYSKVDYVNSQTKVCIICHEKNENGKEHGEFWQLPSNHIHKTHHRGCSKCKGGVKHDRDLFIEKARKVHGEKYDYSKVEYVNANTKVCIICPEHGEFWQDANSHLGGAGCPKCWDERRNTVLLSNTEEFIEKARKVHGEKYDYSKVEYVRSNQKMRVICPEHGEFLITPNKHLCGGGCKECGKITAAQKRRSSLEAFIEKARKVHGDKYDYSKVEYTNQRGKVCIICPEHGEFWQKASNHLTGKGCIKCVKRCIDRDSFIEVAKEVHGEKYDYSKVEYVNSNTKVCIICPEHGEFWQNPSNHLNGMGCRKCNRSHLEREMSSFLESKNIEYECEKTFKWLGRQEIDFYLPKYNVAIECQGIQHFSFREQFSEPLETIIERDERKRKLCNKNGVKLLYYSNLGIKYPYHVFEDKDELLNEIINK